MAHKKGVVGVESQDIRTLVNDELGLSQLFEVVDARFAEMILCDVGDQGDVRVLDGEATTQHSAARCLQEGNLDAWVP